LTYGRKYRVEIDPGVLRTAQGQDVRFAGTAWTFETKKSPPPADVERIVVAADGSGDFNTAQGAIDFAPANPQKRLTIFIKKG
ncbi:hypothetical protein, partial [Salmonella enterica]|uniref:hypothetical protein n=1 Tax=Salmonella enterica TaxID=28901 RepID=UPI0032995C27